MRYALVPRNLDMSVFGDKADKIAMILNDFYKKLIYGDSSGVRIKRNYYDRGIPLNVSRLKEVIGENASPLMDLICYSKRHKNNGTAPIVEVLKRVSPPVIRKRSACYVLVEPYRVNPTMYKLERINALKFKHDKEKMKAEIAGWPENYRTVCENVEKLSLKMDEEQYNHLIEFTRLDYWKKDRDKFVERRVPKLTERYPELTWDQTIEKAKALYERHSEKRIKKLDEKHDESLFFIEMKFREMEGEYEFPVYKLDDQGRLHYYLTNMPESMRQYIRLDGCKMVSYDLGTSQCVFVLLTLKKYIQEQNITLDVLKSIADEIMETIKHCGDGTIPDYVLKGLHKLKRKRSPNTLDIEMKQLGRLLGKDFYADIMQTIGYPFGRKKFKTDVLFPFLYGRMPSWKNVRTKNGVQTERKTMMEYFLAKFPAIYCVLWKMRRFTEICRVFHRLTEDGVHPLTILEYITETYQTAEFPKEMQRLEADMFYNVIIPQIKQPCVTIHDSIIVQAGKKCDVMNIIKKAFMDKHQIKVRVSCERW